MPRPYTRPELTKSDLTEFQAGKCIMINPELKDIAKALKQTEKRCRTNKLPLSEAQAAWRAVVEESVITASAGKWSAPKRGRFPTSGTTIQVVRLSDDLIGLVCDRQEVNPGRSTTYSLPFITPRARESDLYKWMRRVLEVFWTHLSDDDVYDIKARVDFWAMLRARESNARAGDRDKRRRKALESLYRGEPPEYATEFSTACQKLAEELSNEGQNAINWRTLKQAHPSLSSRYQNEFLLLLDEGRISVQALRTATVDSVFSARFSVWDGAQRVFDDPQLVFDIRNAAIHEEFNQRSQEYVLVSDGLRRVAAKRSHPGTATTIGWLRVHVDDENRVCFVDEVQSDTLEAARRMTGAPVEQFQKACQDWHLHGFATICRWAARIGYRAGIHSQSSASRMPGMSPSERKWNTYYRPIIKRFGLIEQPLQPYPGKIYLEDAR